MAIVVEVNMDKELINSMGFKLTTAQWRVIEKELKELENKYNDQLAQLDLYYKSSIESIKRTYESLYDSRYKEGYRQGIFDKNTEIIERLGKILTKGHDEKRKKTNSKGTRRK